MSDAAAPETSLIRQFIAQRREVEPRFSVSSFAELVGCPRSAIYRILNGEDDVGNNLFVRIEITTGIKAVDLFAEWHGKRARAVAALEAALQTDANSDAA